MAKVNPHSPYLGIRGGYKGGGRRKVFMEKTHNIGIMLPDSLYKYVKAKGVSMGAYIRRLIEEDMRESQHIEQSNKGR